MNVKTTLSKPRVKIDNYTKKVLSVAMGNQAHLNKQ